MMPLIFKGQQRRPSSANRTTPFLDSKDPGATCRAFTGKKKVLWTPPASPGTLSLSLVKERGGRRVCIVVVEATDRRLLPMPPLVRS